MTPPVTLRDYRPLHQAIQRLSDEEVWVLRGLARLRTKSRDLRIFDVTPLRKHVSITRCVGDLVPHLRGLHGKGFLVLTRKKARTTDDGNTLKHVLQALDSELTLFDSLTELDDWRARVELYREELRRRSERATGHGGPRAE